MKFRGTWMKFREIERHMSESVSKRVRICERVRGGDERGHSWSGPVIINVFKSNLEIFRDGRLRGSLGRS